RVIDSNASGNAVQSTTREKINHTWFASHSGPIDRSMSARGRSPRSAPPATRSQNPAPKSAPARTAYALIPANSTIAPASSTDGLLLLLVRPVGLGVARAVGGVVVDELVLPSIPPGHAPQHEDHGRRQ